jgi:hypothetical protein
MLPKLSSKLIKKFYSQDKQGLLMEMASILGIHIILCFLAFLEKKVSLFTKSRRIRW